MAALADLRVADVMTPAPLTVAEHETLASAWEILARAGCRALPVLRGTRVVGVVDDHAAVVARSTKWLDGRPRLVGDAAGPAATVRPWASIPELLERFSAAAAPAVVVVDGDGAPVGLVTVEHLVTILDRCVAERIHGCEPVTVD